MSAASLSSSPLLESALAVVAKMSRDEKAVLADRIEAELSFDEVPDWHLEVLKERTALGAKGLDPAIPAEEAFRQIRDRRKS